MIRLEGALINHSTAKIKALVWKPSVDNQYFGNNTPAYLCSCLSTDWNKYSYIWILPRTWLCFKTPKLSLRWEDLLTSSQLIFIPAPSFHIVETVFFSNEVALAGGMPVLEKHLALDQLSLATVYTTNISLGCQHTRSEPGSHTPNHALARWPWLEASATFLFQGCSKNRQ